MSHQFCPLCGNLLLIDISSGKTELKCRTCGLQLNYVGQKIQEAPLNPMDPNNLVAPDATAFQQKTEIKCEKCGNMEAYYKEIQIRSADEPTTIFYYCTKCGYQWREG